MPSQVIFRGLFSIDNLCEECLFLPGRADGRHLTAQPPVSRVYALQRYNPDAQTTSTTGRLTSENTQGAAHFSQKNRCVARTDPRIMQFLHIFVHDTYGARPAGANSEITRE